MATVSEQAGIVVSGRPTAGDRMGTAAETAVEDPALDVGPAGLGTEGLSPFDQVDWELRLRLKSRMNAERAPSFNRSTARSRLKLGSTGHERGGEQVLLRRPGWRQRQPGAGQAREYSVRQLSVRPRDPDDFRLGEGRRLFRHGRGCPRGSTTRLTSLCVNPVRLVLIRRSGSTWKLRFIITGFPGRPTNWRAGHEETLRRR